MTVAPIATGSREAGNLWSWTACRQTLRDIARTWEAKEGGWIQVFSHYLWDTISPMGPSRES